MVEVQIISARKEDFEQVFELLPQLWPERNLDQEKIFQVYMQALESKQQEYIIARNDEHIVGFISMRIITNLWAQGNLLQIEELVVDETYRSMQIGSKLLQIAIAIAKQNNCRTVEVTSHVNRTRAHHFYEINGFKKLAVHFLREIVN
jgi:ribosomal protein S18 acetylase RimI-like enzyme